MTDALFDHPGRALPPSPAGVHHVAEPDGKAGNAANGTAGGGPRPAPPAAPRIIGLDLSLSCTGVAGDGWTDTATFPSVPRDGGLRQRHTRLRMLRSRIVTLVGDAEIVAIEGPAHHMGAQPGSHEASGLWWLVVDSLIRRDVVVIVLAPQVIKKLATGKGNAGKDLVLSAAIRRIAGFDGGSDEADAAWARQAVLAHYLPHLAAPVPAAQRDALAKVAWPALTELTR